MVVDVYYYQSYLVIPPNREFYRYLRIYKTLCFSFYIISIWKEKQTETYVNHQSKLIICISFRRTGRAPCSRRKPAQGGPGFRFQPCHPWDTLLHPQILFLYYFFKYQISGIIISIWKIIFNKENLLCLLQEK